MAVKLQRSWPKALLFDETSLRRWLMGLGSRQLVAEDVSSESWPSTGQITRCRTKREVTYNKYICICTTLRKIRW